MDDPSVIIEEFRSGLSAREIARLFDRERYNFILHSGMDAQKLGRFSFIGSDPFLVFRSKNGDIEISDEGGTVSLEKGDPFHALKDLLARFRITAPQAAFPFTCGAVGYFSYDLCRHLERVPSRAADDLDLADCFIGFYDTSIIIDHLKGRKYIASCGFPETDSDKRKTRIKERVGYIKDAIMNKIVGAGSKPALDRGYKQNRAGLEPAPTSNFTKDEYIDAIGRAKRYIADGDIYQVNLSQRFSCGENIAPRRLFERLCDINPAPFSAYMDLGDLKIISASPERFLSKRGRSVHTRPIKGTRPRGSDPAEDERMKIELISSPKDRAEHIMIVDLERNDLGRICEYGTVLPTEFIAIEKYATVFHLVSTVSGTLREDVDAVDCLINCFPGGSITGAPKIRSMEIIDELEPTRRSIYTGSIGYIGFDGNMDSSVVIRTFIVKGGRVYFQVGGGIVADSDPEMEYQETLDKAKALFESLGVGDTSGDRLRLELARGGH